MTKGILQEGIHHAQERREQAAAAPGPQRVLGGILFLRYSIKDISFSKAVQVDSVKGAGPTLREEFLLVGVASSLCRAPLEPNRT